MSRWMRHHRWSIGVTGVVVGLLIAGCDGLTVTTPTSPTSTPAASPSVSSPREDYYTVIGPAHHLYTPTQTDQVAYCPLDAHQRATCAYGLLTHTVTPNSDGELPDPAGWPAHNRDVTIPALPTVKGSTAYHGWMFNRSHLVADSLGGDEITPNLVTGTRTQNVGSHHEQGQYAGGMAHTEVMARDYLATGRGRDCPLYYAATPQYIGSELIPRTVIVDIDSCDHQLNQRVEVSNTAAGWTIDYTTGSFTRTQ